MQDYQTGLFQTYEAVHVIHLNLNGGQITRKLSAGEQCQFDGSTIILGDDTRYMYTEFRGAIHRGWARALGSGGTEVSERTSPKRTIRSADMTSGVSKHVPEIVPEDSKEVGKVDSSGAVELFLRDLRHRLGGAPSPTATPAPSSQGSRKFALDSGHAEVRDLSHLAPATPGIEGRAVRKMSGVVFQEQREVGGVASGNAYTMEESARAVVSNPESVATQGGASVGTPFVSRMPDGTIKIARKFKTPSNPIVGLESTPVMPGSPVEESAPRLETALEQARYETVRFFVKGFEWDKDRSPNDRVKEAVAVKDKNILKGIMAVEDDVVRSKVSEMLSQRAARQKGAVPA